MRRLFYGSLTLDVADEVAELLLQLSQTAAESRWQRSMSNGRGMFMSQAYAVGRVEMVTISGTLPDGQESAITLAVGYGIPIAVGTADRGDDPFGTPQSIENLRAKLAEYEPDED